MRAFVQANFWRALPVVAAVVVWGIGYIYMHPLLFGLCSAPYAEVGYTGCLDSTFRTVGEPAVVFGKWLLAVGVIMFFVRIQILKRWAIFAALFLIVATVLIHTSPTTSGLPGLNEKLLMANALGIFLLVITLVWMIVHTVILKRKTRVSK